MSTNAEPPVMLRYEGSAAILTLNNPSRMNAVSVAMRQALLDLLLEVYADDRCRAVVLTGSGDHFCSGGDISEMRRRTIIEGRMRLDLPTRIFKLIVSGPKPVIAAVEGNAFGCGVSFVAASDYAVAASDARFSSAFIKVGLIPDHGGLWAIARRVGSRRAMEMCAFADVYTAEEAAGMQLINRVCVPGQAVEEALEVAERLARNPPIAMALLKAGLNEGIDKVSDAIATEVDFVSILQSTEDFGEAASAFLGKRQPRFSGR